MNKEQLINDNANALKTAAAIKLGQTVIQATRKQIEPHLPPFLVGYARNPIFDVVIANLINIVLSKYVAQTKKTQLIAECVMRAAMVNTVDSFKLDEIVNNILGTIKIPASLNKTSELLVE